MATIRGWAAPRAGKPVVPHEYDPSRMRAEEVEVAVENCGLCHSDLSVINNELGFSRFPVVPGHEVVGRVVALGEAAKGLKVGQRVGTAWTVASCRMTA